MKRSLSLALVPGLAAFLGASIEAQEAEPVAKIRALSADILKTLQDKNRTDPEKRKWFKDTLGAEVGWEDVSRLVLARHWRQFNDDQRARFIVQFKDHLVHSYWKNTDTFDVREIEIKEGRQESNADWTVRTLFIQADDTTPVIYRLRRVGGDPPQWKIIDVLVEGVSLLANLRSQFASLLARDPPDAVIEMVRKKNDEAEKKYGESQKK
jgi:phospholipid transport system substrate-binding protein